MTATAAATQRAYVLHPHKRRLMGSSTPRQQEGSLEHAGDQLAVLFGRREYRILFVS